jgi:hypothetical protein
MIALQAGDRDKSEIKFDSHRFSNIFKLILTIRMSFFCACTLMPERRFNSKEITANYFFRLLQHDHIWFLPKKRTANSFPS